MSIIRALEASLQQFLDTTFDALSLEDVTRAESDAQALRDTPSVMGAPAINQQPRQLASDVLSKAARWRELHPDPEQPDQPIIFF